jgi:hypothetical protein
MSSGRRRERGQQRRPGRGSPRRAGALPCDDGSEGEDDDPVFGIILANRYVGSCWAQLLGCWLARGLRGWAVLLGCAMSCSAR